MGLFALKDIQPYTEITYDYNFHAYNIDSQVNIKFLLISLRTFLMVSTF